jgi:hypothetical protein
VNYGDSKILEESAGSVLVSVDTPGISEKETPILRPIDANLLLAEEMRQLDELRSTCHKIISGTGDLISCENTFLVATLGHCAEVSQVKKKIETVA